MHIDIDSIKASRLFDIKPDKFEKTNYPKGRTFKRLTLTFNEFGRVTASVQWAGTCGARGVGHTIDEALIEAVKYATGPKWGNRMRWELHYA